MIPSLFGRTETFMMLLFMLLLLMVSWTEAGYTGVVFTHTAKNVQGSSVTSMRRIKLSSSSCAELQSWWDFPNKIDESSGEWCLKELTGKSTGLNFDNYWGRWEPPNWINNRNSITIPRFQITYELRKRSDINRPNSSPQTGIIPFMRVPSNCQRNISLLTFDPDRDNVKCRYGSSSNKYECYICRAPSVLSLSSPCSLSFSPTSSSNEGSYAVQLMMEDFPRQTITLTDSSGLTSSWSPSSSMSQISVQFVFKVDPAAPSCTAGEYLPRFLPPTPEHGAQFFIDVNETIEINIRAEATQSEITELLFSGPFNMTKSSSGSGYFTLTWTPSAIDDEETHPICFVVQAKASSSVYQSELRCVIVTVSNITATAPPSPPPETSRLTVLKLKISTTLPLKDNKDEIEKAIKDELIRRGLPADIKVRLLSEGSVQVKEKAAP